MNVVSTNHFVNYKVAASVSIFCLFCCCFVFDRVSLITLGILELLRPG